MMPAIKKAFDLMGDDIVDIHTGNEASKNQMGDFDEILVSRIQNKTFETDL